MSEYYQAGCKSVTANDFFSKSISKLDISPQTFPIAYLFSQIFFMLWESLIEGPSGCHLAYE